jgi:predicted ester cyclase
MEKDLVLERLRRPVSPEEYHRIREEWKAHSLAEDRRDLAGLLATLTPDCVYEVVTTGTVWKGHRGAREFYTGLLTAFPDIAFTLTDIVIGPQGVCEEARVTATHAADWLGFRATGGRVEFRVVIFFPWDPASGKFAGERIYVHGVDARPA